MAVAGNEYHSCSSEQLFIDYSQSRGLDFHDCSRDGMFIYERNMKI